MGQDSSQVSASNEEYVGRADHFPKAELKGKKSFNRELSGDGGSGEERSPRGGSTKASERRKKRRRKRKSSSFSQAAPGTIEEQAHVEMVGEEGGLARDSQVSQEMDEAGGVEATQSFEAREREKAGSIAKQQRLLYIAIAATAEVNGRDSGVEVKESASDDVNDAMPEDKLDVELEVKRSELEPEVNPEIVTKPAKMSKNSHKSAGVQLIANGRVNADHESGQLAQDVLQEAEAQDQIAKLDEAEVYSSSTKARQSSSKPHRAAGDAAANKDVKNPDTVLQLPTPDASRRIRTRKLTDDDIVVSSQLISGVQGEVQVPSLTLIERSQPSGKRRKSKKIGENDTEKVPKEKQKPSANNADVALSNEEMLADASTSHPPQFGCNSYDPRGVSPSASFASYSGFARNLYDESTFSENHSYDYRANTPSSSSPLNVIIPISSDARTTQLKTKTAKETRIVPPNAINGSAIVQSPVQRKSAVQGEEAINSLLEAPATQASKGAGIWSAVNVDSEPGPQMRQIGVYRGVETPQTTVKRKRRLPVDDYAFDQPATSESRKKSRKPPLKPKTPDRKSLKSMNSAIRDGSPELDEAVSTTNGPKRKRAKKAGAKEPTVSGKFSDVEIAIITNEMLKHREVNGLTVYDQNQLVHKNANAGSELWDEICAALPGRTRQAIIKICRRRFHNYGARGKWTSEEDQQLKDTYERFPDRWKQIGQILNRHSEDARDRWRNYLVCGDKQKKDFWTEAEERNLRSAVAECVQAVKELKDAQVASNPGMERNTQPDIELIDWQVVSLKLGRTRSRLQCITKWKHLSEREDSDNVAVKDLKIGERSWRAAAASRSIKNMTQRDYIELLTAIRQSQAGREGKIPWKKLGDLDLRTKWPCMARKVAWKKLRATIPGNEDMKLQDIVTMLIDNLPLDLLDVDDKNGSGDTPTPKLLRKRKSKLEKPMLRETIIHSDEEGDGSEEEPRGTRKENKKPSEPMAMADSFIDELSEEEFNPDDIAKPHASLMNGHHHSTEDMVRDAADEAYEDNGITEDGDGDSDSGSDSDSDVIMTNGHQYVAESVDLDASSQPAARLSSPFSFNVILNPPTPKHDDMTQSDEDNLDMDIPAKRPVRARGSLGVDLDRA